MSQPLEKVEADALELTLGERARLAQRLLVSLDEQAEDDPAEVEAAWEEEIRCRVAEVDAGTAELVPGEEVIAELRARQRR